MRCSDTVLAFLVFFVFGGVHAIWPRKLIALQVAVEKWIPLPDFLLYRGWINKPWFVTLVRIQGLAVMGFGLFLLQWHLRHCR